MLSQYRRISTEVFSYKYCSTIVLVLQYRIYVTESVLGMNRYKKRRMSHDIQSFVNLKSNTMKNTMQRYTFLTYMQ